MLWMAVRLVWSSLCILGGMRLSVQRVCSTCRSDWAGAQGVDGYMMLAMYDFGVHLLGIYSNGPLWCKCIIGTAAYTLLKYVTIYLVFALKVGST